MNQQTTDEHLSHRIFHPSPKKIHKSKKVEKDKANNEVSLFAQSKVLSHGQKLSEEEREQLLYKMNMISKEIEHRYNINMNQGSQNRNIRSAMTS